MKPPKDFVRIIDQKRYSTATATLLADDAYWDGHNFERSGTNTFLYRTHRGNYFSVYLTQWQGDRDTLTPLTMEEAIALYEQLNDSDAIPFKEAFPDATLEDA